MKTILCLGDSITDCGRLFASSPLGDGYVSLLNGFQEKEGLGWHITNQGNDGFTVLRLVDKFSHFIPDLSFDIITVLIGINDIALMKNTCRSPEEQKKMMRKFFSNYDALIRLLKKHTRRILLMEPFLFPCPQEYLGWLPELREMSSGISHLAETYRCSCLRLHDDLNLQAKLCGTDAVTIDGVHLTPYGHKFLAERLFPILRDLLSE